jgi:N-acetylneuraminic acid mutarotase
MNKKHTAQSAFFDLRILVTLFLFAVAACALLNRPLLAFLRSETSTNVSQRTLTFAERVGYQRAIEDVYWRHRIWPKENTSPKPSLDAVMSQAQLEKKVEDYLRSTQALQDYWQRPITAEDLQAEMDRMAENTKQPEVLRELFDALGNDPFLVAECLVRPVLSERLITSLAQDQRNGRLALSEFGANSQTRKVVLANATYTLPAISDATTGCTPDTWTPTSTPHAPPGRLGHTAVWTGSEMIVWGGDSRNGTVNTGGRYDPVSDSWIKTSNKIAPTPRMFHTAVWTGSEMIVWGGCSDVSCNNEVNTGGRYNPSTDTWTATSTTNAPEGRVGHTAVWTGSEMIVWGGTTLINFFNTGGRYNPGTDNWTATSTTNAPVGRELHTAVWTGSEMIVWGGVNGDIGPYDTGSRYNPGTDSWTAMSTTNAPAARWFHTAVWTGSEMIVWGGTPSGVSGFQTGGRYNVGSDSWAATNTNNAPLGRILQSAVWTGSEMIIWGGTALPGVLNTGGRYTPDSDSWTGTTTTDAPSARADHTAVWTGSEMIIWGGGGFVGPGRFNTGGRYCAQSGSPTPTPTATPTATATATPTATTTPTSTPTATGTVSPTPTATARPSPTPRSAPTPRSRPTPAPRP